MLNYTFDKYCLKNNKFNKKVLWEQYKNDIILKGGYENVFDKFKLDNKHNFKLLGITRIEYQMD